MDFGSSSLQSKEKKEEEMEDVAMFVLEHGWLILQLRRPALSVGRDLAEDPRRIDQTLKTSNDDFPLGS